MVNYRRAKVYKLVKKGGDELGNMYIGSTCQPLCVRLCSHRGAARTGKKHSILLQWMRDVGPENVQILWIADIPCESFEQQRAKEQEYIDKLKPSLNMHKAHMAHGDYLAYHRAWGNKIRRAAGLKPRVKYDTDEERVAAEKARHKTYRESNKEKIAQYKRDWAARNKEKVARRQREWYERKKQNAARSKTKKNPEVSCT